MVQLGLCIEVGPGVGSEKELGAGIGAGFEGRVEAGPQARAEEGHGKVWGILGLWRHLRFC